MASVTLRGLTKTFDGGARPALQELSLEVRDGEFLVLLGPSGCGKTTALRCIAGLDEPTDGQIMIGERDVTHLAPAARDVAMVFQTYALYPHLTVRENIAFALELRRVLHAGRLRQLGTPAELYERPADVFVARFVGHPGMNVLQGRGTRKRERTRAVECGSLALPVALPQYDGEVQLGVRPEHVALCPPAQGAGNG